MSLLRFLQRFSLKFGLAVIVSLLCISALGLQIQWSMMHLERQLETNVDYGQVEVTHRMSPKKAYVGCPKEKHDNDVIQRLSSIGGIYMEITNQQRPLARFFKRPWKVERAIQNGECGYEPDHTKWNMVFLVKSAIKNRNRRDAIRSTWGSVKIYDDVMFETVFILGSSNETSDLDDIEVESSLHGDILQYNLHDSAKTVPEKVVAGMQWSSEALTARWQYASMDDDMVLNPQNLVNYYNQLLSNHSDSLGKVCFDDLPLVCVYSYQSADPPARKKTSKWYMPPENFPGDVWPVYCRGGLYTTSHAMVRDLFAVSRRTTHLYLDDVWITGFMRRKLRGGDYNIVAAPHSIMSDHQALQDTDVRELLVKHLWGNINSIKVNVPIRILQVWKEFEPTIEDHIQCRIT
ncbi:unnamed protein product [Clavelina lepadiformis]|uniref:Hexosyltransferase n=1 Tax=Clavelina lepadiformis TaxID=159417 RepID=A0ABP0FNC1_CLALP